MDQIMEGARNFQPYPSADDTSHTCLECCARERNQWFIPILIMTGLIMLPGFALIVSTTTTTGETRAGWAMFVFALLVLISSTACYGILPGFYHLNQQQEEEEQPHAESLELDEDDNEYNPSSEDMNPDAIVIEY